MLCVVLVFFFFNDTATTEIYTLSLHDALPISAAVAVQQGVRVQSEYSIDALGTKVVADILYGTVLIDSSSNKRGYRFVNN